MKNIPQHLMDKIKHAANRGYAITSNRHLAATRIDRPDWREYIAKKHSPWDPEGEGMSWVACLDKHQRCGAADFYRRVYSKDEIRVPQHWIGRMKNSNEGYSEFVG